MRAEYLKFSSDLAKVQEYWAIKYPRFSRTKILGRNYVLLNSPILIQKLFNSTDFGHLVKPEEIYSKLFIGVVGKGLLIANREYNLCNIETNMHIEVLNDWL